MSQSLICSRPEEIKRVGFSLQNLRVLSHTIDSIANSLFVVNQREKERERITLRKKQRFLIKYKQRPSATYILMFLSINTVVLCLTLGIGRVLIQVSLMYLPR